MSEDVPNMERQKPSLLNRAARLLGVAAFVGAVNAPGGSAPVTSGQENRPESTATLNILNPLEPRIAGAQGNYRRFLGAIGRNSTLDSPPTPTPEPTVTPDNTVRPYANLKEMADMTVLTYSKEKVWEGKVRKLETRRSSRWNISSTIKPEYEQQVIDEISKDLANQQADRIVIVMLENINETPPEIVAPPAWPNDWKEYAYNRNGVNRSYGYFAIKKYTSDNEAVVTVGYAKPSEGFLNESEFMNRVTGELGQYLGKGSIIGRDVSYNNSKEADRGDVVDPLYAAALRIIGV